MSSRRGGVWALLALGGALLVSTAPVWFSAAAGGADAVTVGGGRAAPGVVAGGVVVLAAGLALALARRVGAVIAATVAAGGALLAAASAAGSVGRAQELAAAAAADQTGVDAVGAVSVGAWPWVAAGLAGTGVALALWIGWSARTWALAGARHEPASTRPVTDDAWDALTRGEDPT